MLPHLFILLPLTAATSLKAVPYGETKSAQTLFKPAPSSTSTSINVNEPHETHHTPLLEETSFGNLSKHVEIEPSLVQDLQLGTDIAAVDINTIDEIDGDLGPASLVPENSTSDHEHGGLDKRQQGRYRGTMQIDCFLAPDIFKNAGYYQNCIRNAQGNNLLVLYTDGDRVKTTTDDSRVQSGVTLQGPTPCNGWPFAQRFWHPQNNGIQFPELQTDEWPMATFQNAQFNPNAAVPQVSLRCMPYYENNRGSQAWTQFRNCNGPYVANQNSKAWRKWGGKYAWSRQGPCTPMIPGDTFNVNFDFSFYPPRGQNTTADAIYDDLGYARGPFGPGTNTCDNDGFQFHLSRLRGRGIYHNPYDTTLSNAYRITGQIADIQQWKMVMEVWGGTNLEYFTIEITRVNNGNRLFVLQSAGQLPVGGTTLIAPTLAMPLKFSITRTSCRYEFEYGDPNADRVRWFKFNSQDAGYEPSPEPRTDKPDGQYCWTTDLPNDPRDPAGARRIQCVFPAW